MSREQAISAFKRWLTTDHAGYDVLLSFEDEYAEHFDSLTCPDCGGKGERYEGSASMMRCFTCPTCEGKGWRDE